MADPFINGEYVAFPKLERMPIVDPSNGEDVDTVPLLGAAGVDQAVQSAYAAFPGWRDTPASKRGELLGAAAEAVLSAIEELAPLLTSEHGDKALRPHPRALCGDGQEHPGRLRARPG
jgi:acyl-CoA reductase-like NAD-dependent aldehyde dehydrogenase